jgi:hypothetical protein
MFSKLNDLTLTTLVYELFEVKYYNKGEVICLQSKQAPTNYAYRPFYQMQLSKLALEIKKRKQGINASAAHTTSTANQSVILDESKKANILKPNASIKQPKSRKMHLNMSDDFSDSEPISTSAASPTKLAA